MVVRLVLWNLADSQTTVAELRDYLRDEAVDAFANVPGLLFKSWISDELGERWGAIYLFESAAAASPSASTRRVSRGSITPSSQSRAVEYQGDPSRS